MNIIVASARMAMRFAKSPKTVGSAFPSSRGLGKSMADAVGNPSSILEVGAGCGAVTKVLCERFGPSRVTAVEIDVDCVDRLREIQGLSILNSCVCDVLPSLDVDPARVIVSSLPFRSLPTGLSGTLAMALSDAILSGRAGRMVQFSYIPVSPFQAPDGLSWSMVDIVPANIPPAFVFTLSPSDKS